MSETFCVYQFFANDVGYEKVAQYVPPEEAIRIYNELVSSLGATIGTTEKIIITDGFDLTVLEWQYDKGIVFPPELNK